jgi:hypothetical protein
MSNLVLISTTVLVASRLKNGLVCLQRDSSSMEVPGCDNVNSNICADCDYCVRPLNALVLRNRFPLGRCEGSCIR